MKKTKLLSLALIGSIGAYAQNFEITFNVTENPPSSGEYNITIPTHPGSSYTYNYEVDWDNDGNFETTGVTGDITHDFGLPGSRTIKIRGTFPAIFFKNSEDKEKLTAINNWGGSSFGWQTFDFAFAGCSNLNSLPPASPDLSSVTDLSYMFLDATSFNSSEVSDWDMSTITNMRGMFAGATAFNQQIGNWIVDNVTDMSSLFAGATSFNKRLNWNTANVTDMSSMFQGASAFNYNLQSSSNWNTESVTDMSHMFDGASSFDQYLGDWNIGSVENMSSMLNGTNLDDCTYENTLKGWDDASNTPSNITLGADGLFYKSSSARDNLVDVSGSAKWTIVGDLENKTDICPDPSWFVTEWTPTSNNTDITIPTNPDPFYTYNYDVDWNGDGDFLDANESGHTGDATQPGFVVRNKPYVINIRGDFPAIFFNNSGDKELITKIVQWGTIEWETFQNAFYGCENLTIVPGLPPDLSNVINLSAMFKNCTSFNGQMGNWDISTIVSMSEMFRGASNFEDGGIGNWQRDDLGNTSTVENVTSFVSMFEDATSFNTNIGDWNVSGAQFMRELFRNASAFENGNKPLDWERPPTDPNGESTVGNVTEMIQMFTDASSFNQDINDWDVSGVKNMQQMFQGATVFNQDISAWDVSQVTTMLRMFRNAASFNRDISTWDVTNCTTMVEMFAGTDDFNQSLQNWERTTPGNTSTLINVTNMKGMFSGASSYNQPMNNWKVDNVTDMSSMFYFASDFNSNITNWNVGNVTTMFRMFKHAESFNQDISNWDVSSVAGMGEMFDNALAFNQDIGSWNLSSITPSTGMANMLNSCGMGWDAYDKTLIGWNNNVSPSGNSTTPTGITLGATGLYFCNADIVTTPVDLDITSLDHNHGWTITDAGRDCNPANMIIKPIPTTNSPTFNATTNQTLQLSPNSNSPTKQKKSSVGNTSSNQISVNTLSNGNLLVKQSKPSAVNNQLTLEVFSLNGQRVYQASQSTTNNNFNLSNLAKGAYVVKITTNNTVETQKISIP